MLIRKRERHEGARSGRRVLGRDFLQGGIENPQNAVKIPLKCHVLRFVPIEGNAYGVF